MPLCPLKRLKAKISRSLLKSRLARSEAGFSIAELVTVTAFMGILSTVGIANYRSQQMRAKTAEAKHSLISLYSFQQEFKAAWGTYHGNLVLIGATPHGPKMYDVGFTDGTTGDGKTLPLPEGGNGRLCSNTAMLHLC